MAHDLPTTISPVYPELLDRLHCLRPFLHFFNTSLYSASTPNYCTKHGRKYALYTTEMSCRNPISFGRALGWGAKAGESRPSGKGLYFTCRKCGNSRRRYRMVCLIRLQCKILTFFLLFLKKLNFNHYSRYLKSCTRVRHRYLSASFPTPVSPGSKGDIYAPWKEFNSIHPSCQKFLDRRSIFSPFLYYQ